MTDGTRTPASELTPGALVHGTHYAIATDGSGTTTPVHSHRTVLTAERQGNRMRVTMGPDSHDHGVASLDVAYPADHVLIVTPAPTGERVTADDLSAWAEFGSPFRVHPDGTVAAAHDEGVYAPEIVYVSDDADTLDEVPAGWHALRGYTGQYSYTGPIMHASEQLGGRLAGDVLSTPGLYVVVTVDDYTEDDEPAGWAVIARPDAA
jgi:hypothetical protein